jgi:DNA-binding NtrC family response regulator
MRKIESFSPNESVMRMNINTMNNLRLLVLNGKSSLLEDVQRILPGEDVFTFETATASDAIRVMNENPIDIVIIEVEESARQCQQFFRSLSSKHTDVGILILDRNDGLKHLPIDRGTRGEVTRLSYPFSWDDVRKSIENMDAYVNLQNRLRQLNENFQQFSQEIVKKNGLQIVGNSKAIQSIASQILLVSKAQDTSVMITGESGTGKELVARGIHTLSARGNQHFHAVNCSAIPESLFESEFFGYRKGAFTGAIEKSTGWFEIADKGTLFLDEITELPMPMQSKFLRVLDDKVVQKIGSHEEITVNLRIISASNQDLDKLQDETILRKDLYHRLNAFHIHVPPLRERKEDIPVLLDYFICQVSKKLNQRPKPVSEKVLEKLMSYSFPGNVRELRNMIECAVIVCQEPKLKLNHFCFDSETKAELLSVPPQDKNFNLADLERHIILEALNKTRFVKTKTAALLNISRQSLDRKIIKLGIRV